VSPEYFGYDIIWHIPPDQKMDANTMTKAIFGKDKTKRESTSVLIYRLQRKKHPEPNMDNTSTSPQLLIIWGYDNMYEYSVCVLLIKYDHMLTLDEGKLKKIRLPHHIFAQK
jgi:hypothetical protein